MRHGKKINHLGRKTAHRKAMLSNMATSLILNKRIFTTTAKAKALRKYVEPLISKSKEDSTNSRRVVFSYLQDKYSVNELFTDVAARVATRPGGYTRIIKTGNRLGDNADMCMIELVDYNDIYGAETKTAAKPKTRRSRSGSTGTKTEDAGKEAKSVKEETPQTKKEEPKAEVVEKVEEKVEESNVEAAAEENEEESPKKDDETTSPDAEEEVK